MCLCQTHIDKQLVFSCEKYLRPLQFMSFKTLEPTMHPYKIQTKLAKVNSFKYSFFVRIVKDGNSLPKHLFTDEINVNKFKKGLKRWMKIY